MKTIFKTALIGSFVSLTSLYAIQGIAAPRGDYMGDCQYQERQMQNRGSMERGFGKQQPAAFMKRGKGMKMRPKGHRLLAGLDLSQDQQDQVTDIDREYNEKFYQLDKQLRDNRIALADLNSPASDGQKSVNQLATEHGELVAKAIILRQEKRSKVEALLTEEQAAQLADRKMQRQPRWAY